MNTDTIHHKLHFMRRIHQPVQHNHVSGEKHLSTYSHLVLYGFHICFPPCNSLDSVGYTELDKFPNLDIKCHLHTIGQSHTVLSNSSEGKIKIVSTHPEHLSMMTSALFVFYLSVLFTGGIRELCFFICTLILFNFFMCS